MSDLIERLRDEEYRGPLQHLRSYSDLDKLHDEAADAIAALRAALEPFAKAEPMDVYESEDEDARGVYVLTQDDFRRADAAIRSLGKEGSGVE